MLPALPSKVWCEGNTNARVLNLVLSNEVLKRKTDQAAAIAVRLEAPLISVLMNYCLQRDLGRLIWRASHLDKTLVLKA